MLIKNASALVGSELDYIQNIDIRVKDGKFEEIKPNLELQSDEKYITCTGLLLIPGFVNCHTHIGDSIAKDIFLNSTVNKRIHPVFGIKPKILKNTLQEHLVTFMRISCISMMRKGITTFVDFREGGVSGVLLLQQAVSDLLIRSIILGRLELYHDHLDIQQNTKFPKQKISELDDLLNKCDGLGISGANENSDSMLKYYSKISKIRAIHSAETKQSTSKSIQMTGRSEPLRALELEPHFLVHMTHANESELRSVAKHEIGIVVCPRANASLAEGIPDVDLMRRSGCIVALGTDNVMINSPDMFREMDYLWKVTMGIHKKRIDPREILKMATVNGGKILHKNIGAIETGMTADCIFLDKHTLNLAPMHSPHASIVHRADESSIKDVMIGGKLVYGNL